MRETAQHPDLSQEALQRLGVRVVLEALYHTAIPLQFDDTVRTLSNLLPSHA